MALKKSLVLLTALLLGGCLASSGSNLDARSDASSAHQGRERDAKESGKPRQVCETTSIAGEPKFFCY